MSGGDERCGNDESRCESERHDAERSLPSPWKRCQRWTLMAPCFSLSVGEREEVEWAELDCISHPFHCCFLSNNTLLFHSHAGAEKQSVCNQSFCWGSEGVGEGGHSLCSCLCSQNGINVTLGTRVSLPWWITEGITIMEIVIDWSFVSIYCNSASPWPSTQKCYNVNSATSCYQCFFCSHNGWAL